MPDAVKYANKLHGARVLVLGGSSGIGFGVAEACLEAGVSALFISSSNQDRINNAISRLEESYPSKKGTITGITCDIANKDTLESNIESLLGKVGKLDHLVFTAADHLAIKPLVEMDFEAIQKAGMTRFYAPLLLAKQAKVQGTFEPLSYQKSFTITSGSIRERPRPDWTVIASFAGGHEMMAKSLCLDLQPVRVNIVAPGPVETELWSGMPEDARKQLMKKMAEGTTVKRVADVHDVAESFLYIMRDGNVTGSVINTNGGTSLL